MHLYSASLTLTVGFYGEHDLLLSHHESLDESRLTRDVRTAAASVQRAIDAGQIGRDDYDAVTEIFTPEIERLGYTVEYPKVAVTVDLTKPLQETPPDARPTQRTSPRTR